MASDPNRNRRVGDLVVSLVVGVVVTVIFVIGSTVALEVFTGTTSEDIERTGGAATFGWIYLVVFGVASYVTYRLITSR